MKLRLVGLVALAFMAPSSLAAGEPTMLGTWTGTVKQNAGESNYTVVMTITETGAETNYPELNCGGALTRVGASAGYVFFTETITRDEIKDGNACIDGSVTVVRIGDKLAWGWVGGYEGQVYVAWSNLVRK